MIKTRVNEFIEGDLAVRTVRVSFLGIPIYRYRKETTNSKVVAVLRTVSHDKIKGFI